VAIYDILLLFFAARVQLVHICKRVDFSCCKMNELVCFEEIKDQPEPMPSINLAQDNM
jgi:hypothetical protein